MQSTSPVKHSKLDFVNNPFKHRTDDAFDLLFASANSYVVSSNDWGEECQHQFWVLDTAGDRPIDVRVGKQVIRREPGSAILYRPNTSYCERGERGRLVRMGWLMFRAHNNRSPLNRLVGRGGYGVFDDPGCLLRDLTHHIVSCFLDPKPGKEWQVKSLFYQVLALLCSAEKDARHRIHPLTIDRPRDESVLRDQVEAYLQLNWNRAVTIHELARHLGLSHSALSHRYRQIVGETFVQTRNRLRVYRAKELLLQPNASIKEVAFELGFSDLANFTRIFRRVVGLPPKAFVREIILRGKK